MALRRQKRGTGCLSERRALLKICFLVCSFPLRRIAVTGSCFLFVLFCLCLTPVSRHQNCLQIGYLCIDNFSLLTDSLSLQQCSFKAFIVFFSPLAGFTTMASSFLSTKIKKKQDKAKPARLSRFYFNVQAFIFNKTRYEVVFKTTALKLPPFGFFKTVGS